MHTHHPELAAQAAQLNQEDAFDMEAVAAHNSERRLRQTERRDQRALNRARLVMGSGLDEVEWWANRRKRRGTGHEVGYDTTVSPTSDDCDDECTSSESSSESHDDVDASGDAWLLDIKSKN